MTDFPAAHSMDSTWFAVDADGNIATFDTGEGGCVPEGDFPVGGEAGAYGDAALEDVDLLARALWARAKSDERLRSLLPDSLERLNGCISSSDDWDDVRPLLRSLGVWTYRCDDSVATPYMREGAPAVPLSLDAFDADTRQRFADASLPVRFADSPMLAPGEYAPVQAWGAIWIDTAGKPHPTEGREEDYEAELADFSEWGDGEEWQEEEGDEPIYQGDELYARIEQLVGADKGGGDDESPAENDGGDDEPPAENSGGRSWLRKLFRSS